MRIAVLTIALLLAAAESPVDLVQARLARGDAAGAREALAQVAEPAYTDAAARAACRDALVEPRRVAPSAGASPREQSPRRRARSRR
jgi:hypothetical protein